MHIQGICSNLLVFFVFVCTGLAIVFFQDKYDMNQTDASTLNRWGVFFKKLSLILLVAVAAAAAAAVHRHYRHCYQHYC